MGQLMRQYWLPMVLSSELKPGGRVKRVKLLGEVDGDIRPRAARHNDYFMD